jgi:hypothetical protein
MRQSQIRFDISTARLMDVKPPFSEAVVDVGTEALKQIEAEAKVGGIAPSKSHAVDERSRSDV